MTIVLTNTYIQSWLLYFKTISELEDKEKGSQDGDYKFDKEYKCQRSTLTMT